MTSIARHPLFTNHSNYYTKSFCGTRGCAHYGLGFPHPASRNCSKAVRGTKDFKNCWYTRLDPKRESVYNGDEIELCTGLLCPSKLCHTMMLYTPTATGMIFRTELGTGIICRTESGTWCMFRIQFRNCFTLYRFMLFIVCNAMLCYIILVLAEIYDRARIFTEFCTRVLFTTEVCTRMKVPSEFCTRERFTTEVCNRGKLPSGFRTRVMFPSGWGSVRYRTVGRRKEGEQKSGKQKKGENGNKYGRKNGSGRSRRTSQGNGSSGMEGSGEGSGNGDDSSDDEDDDGDDEELDDDEDDDEDDDDDDMDTDNISAMAEDEAEDTTNGGGDEDGSCTSKVTSTTLEIHTTGIKEEVSNEEDQSTVTALIAPVEPGTPVTLSGVIWKETMGGVLVVNLKWRNKTYSGSLIDHSRYGWANPRNLEEPQECDLSTSSRGSKGKKAKHKKSAYTGNPLSPKMGGNGKRGSRFHRNKGKHNKESSTMSKAKRGSDTAEEGTRTRRRSCTVKTSISPSPSPTPSFIECPERNCNKKYKHINGLRYHQQHAHLDNGADGEDKDSFDEDDMKSCDFKEPLSANSKSSGSDDVKPLSHRKAKNQKANSKTSEVNETVLPEESVENDDKATETERTEDKYDVMEMKSEEKYDVTDIKSEEKYDVTDIKTEDKYDVTDVKNDVKYDVMKMEQKSEPMKLDENTTTNTKPNILEEAVKIIFDEPATSQDLMVSTGIFSRMTSQAMLAASHPPDYNKYVDYEGMEETVPAFGEKTGTSPETQELDVTVKEEVIDEGRAGVAKLSCKDESEETFKLENVEMRFNGAKSEQLPVDETPKSTEDEKPKWSPQEKTGKSRKGDCNSVAKEQIKTSAAEIRSLPGYKHFRLPPNTNSGFLTQAKSLTLDTGLLESKDPQKGGIPKEAPGHERVGEKAEGKSMVWKMQGAPATLSASFQLTCEPKPRPGYKASRNPSVVAPINTWFPEAHPAALCKTNCGGIPGQEVIPEKPGLPRDAPEKMPQPHETVEEQEDERAKTDKGDDERSKGSYSGKPGRAVGVAHPFNAEKSEGEFALGMVGSITTEPVHVLYSKSSSPKMSVDLTHPDMSEVKKVRVEKTLEVPVGEVVPLAKTSRPATTSSRGSVMVDTETRGHFTDVRVSVSGPSPPPREPQQAYTPSSVGRSSPWRPPGSYSPSREHAPRSRGDLGQQYTPTETYTSRKPIQRSPVPDHRSPVPDHRSPPFRSGYQGADIGRRTPEKDYRVMDKRIPFRNIEERLPQKDSNKMMEVSLNSSSKDIPGTMHPSKSESPRKDSPGTFYHRLVPGYRDPERGSPFASDLSRRQYDKSPIRDRRSPSHARRSPDIVERPSFRSTSPSHARDSARHSPYKERVVKQPGETEGTPQRKDSISPVGGTAEVSRGYRMKPEGQTVKETGERSGSQRTDKYPRMTEEEAMMLRARNAAVYQYQAAMASAQDENAARQAMENYMLLSRMSLQPGLDPRIMQAYSPMFTSTQMPLLFQSAKESTMSKDDRPKEASEEIRRKTSNSKPEAPRSRGETSELDVMATKRHADRSSSSRDKIEHESPSIKRSKTSEMKDVHEIIDDKEGGRLQLKTLEQRALQQQLQYKMDALNQLQTEKNLKLKAEDRFNRSKPSSSSSTSSRLKPTIQESRSTISKREDKPFLKDDKSRLSPASVSGQTGSSSENIKTRNPESKSPAPPTSGAPVLGFVPHNLPPNHALSNSYEQAMMMPGYPPFLMPSFPIPHGMMMANPALVPGSQLHSAVTARGLDPKRDPTRGTSSSSDRSRPRDEDSQETESRSESREFSSKKEFSTTPRINPPSSPPMDKPKDKPRGEYDEGKQRRDAHGSQALPANLAFRRADMSGGVFDPFQMMYPGGPGRPPYDHPFMPHQRK